MVSIRAHHDRIVSRIHKAAYRRVIAVNQTVPNAPGNLRPDLVIQDGSEVLVIDVACPFENDANALQEAADRKTQKYHYLVDHFKQQGLTAKIFGFVIGSLGSWHPQNEDLLNEMNISHKYRSLLRKLCCADTIQGSRNIYVEHLTNQRQ